ncbi:MAG: sulfurtransferase TusA family protein [Fuerstiella sp.]|nr:sulfurtransferase TusA family protein [Fuerstiella sp.]MCP4856627.1 sulfurtransferase TusA family protein [Fuerstiella sp.]
MTAEREIDLTGLRCPMPIVRLNKLMKDLGAGEEFTAVADDPAFCLDVASWCRKTGQELVSVDNSNERLVAVIRRNPSDSV